MRRQTDIPRLLRWQTTCSLVARKRVLGGDDNHTDAKMKREGDAAAKLCVPSDGP